MGGHSIFEDAL